MARARARAAQGGGEGEGGRPQGGDRARAGGAPERGRDRGARRKEAERRRIAEAERERKEADKSNTLACDLKARPQHGPKEGILRKPTFATEHERIAHEDFISPAQRARRGAARGGQGQERREEAHRRQQEGGGGAEAGGGARVAVGRLSGARADGLAGRLDRAFKVALNGEDDGHSVRSLATTCVPLNPIDHAVQRGVLRHADRREAQWTRKHGTREPGHDGRVVFRGRPNGVDLVIDPATDAIITVYPARAKK